MGTCRNKFAANVMALGLAAAATPFAAASAADETVAIDGLEWSLTTNGSDIRWPDAVDYCSTLERAGHDDWRLPTMDELKTLHDPDAPNGNGIRSPIVIDTCCLWSGESLEHRPARDGSKPGGSPDRYRWGLIFDGGDEYYAVDLFDDGQALCVRKAE